jgi:hypothetical protein
MFSVNKKLKMHKKFENIKDWLEFVIKSSDNNLTELITDDFVLDGKIKHNISIDNDKIITDFKSRLQGLYLENQIWNETLYHYPKQLPDELGIYLIENKIAMSNLGHTRQSDKIMWVLGQHVEEAALTLGKDIYNNDSYSIYDLKLLLETFYDMHWLWNSLIYENTLSHKKLDLFNELLDRRDDFNDIKVRKRELDIERVLIQTDSVEIITKYFVENNPRFYQVIAQNPYSPINLLNKLKYMKDMKFARKIRNFAIENIKKNKNPL